MRTKYVLLTVFENHTKCLIQYYATKHLNFRTKNDQNWLFRRENSKNICMKINVARFARKTQWSKWESFCGNFQTMFWPWRENQLTLPSLHFPWYWHPKSQQQLPIWPSWVPSGDQYPNHRQWSIRSRPQYFFRKLVDTPFCNCKK